VNLIEPSATVFRRTQDDRFEVDPLETFAAADTENDHFPEMFDGALVNVHFDVAWRVRGRENENRFVRQVGNWSFRRKVISKSLSNDPLNPTAQDRRRTAPPIRMHENQAVRLANFVDELPDDFRQLGFRRMNFLFMQNGVESFGIKIMEGDFVPLLPERLANGLRNGVVETARSLMSENDEVFFHKETEKREKGTGKRKTFSLFPVPPKRMRQLRFHKEAADLRGE